jgi:hypothetical protein
MNEAEDFRRDGAVCVRGAFSPGQVALVERGIERNLSEPSERALVASRGPSLSSLHPRTSLQGSIR